MAEDTTPEMDVITWWKRHEYVKVPTSLNDGNTMYQLTSMPRYIKDPEKTQDPAGIRTQDLLITSQTLLPLSHWISWGREV